MSDFKAKNSISAGADSLGLGPRPRYSVPQTPCLYLRGPTSKRREGEEGRGEREQGKRRRRKGRRRKEREGTRPPKILAQNWPCEELRTSANLRRARKMCSWQRIVSDTARFCCFQLRVSYRRGPANAHTVAVARSSHQLRVACAVLSVVAEKSRNRRTGS